MLSFYGVINLTYDELLCRADDLGLITKEKPLTGYNGRIKGYRIAIKKDIPTLKEKACVLAEEIGHFLVNFGNILDQEIMDNRKQEYKAMAYAFDTQVGLDGLIKIYESGCTSIYDAAECLGITERFFEDALKYYEGKYGIFVTYNQYIIYFKPSLCIIKMLG